MPGKVLRVVAGQGSSVSAGDVLMILEAMKMENEIVAPVGGTVTQLAAKEGASVNSGDVLAVIG
jgi:glutaconyl-CoA decarboxylase